MPTTTPLPVMEIVKKIGLPSKDGTLKFVRGQYFFVSGETNTALPTSFANAAQLGKMIGGDVTAICEPVEELPDGDQRAIHGGDRLTLLPPKVISEVGYVSGGHSADSKRLSVGGAEPTGELPHVLVVCLAGVRREVMVADELPEERCLLPTDRDAVENIIAPIFHRVAPRK